MKFGWTCIYMVSKNEGAHEARSRISFLLEQSIDREAYK
jgi:hypothetical protein